jgi:hypothetical protein
MSKIVLAAATAIILTASSVANAQSPQATSAPPERLNAADRNVLTDMRIDLVKAALQLTPEQEKLWPPVESAIRARADNRRGRIARLQETVGRLADESRLEVLRNRDPVAFLQRRSDALAQRAADLDKLADAWQPLYKTLGQEQKQRLAALAIFVLNDMSDLAERRRAMRSETMTIEAKRLARGSSKRYGTDFVIAFWNRSSYRSVRHAPCQGLI